MQELEKILEEIEQASYLNVLNEKSIPIRVVKDIICNRMTRNDGWIPVKEALPEEPKENPVFDDKPLELYLVDMGGSYPLRAFWNGKQFTDGWSVLNVIAWRPLPDPYCPERSEGE